MTFERRCEKQVPLADLSTFAIGGPARFLFRAKSVCDIQEAFFWASTQRYPVLVIGNGSNCLFSDEGFDGLVIVNRVEEWGEQDRVFHVGGGNSFSAFGIRTARDGWAGVEFAAGIPGTVGGAVVMNAGACGQQVCDTLVYVDYVDFDGRVERYPASNMGYRSSPFQKRKGAVVGAGFRLEKSKGVKERQQAMMERRMSSQPLKERSAGCVFRNPQGASAGRLIEEAGLKGYRVGGAEVSTIHANFIVNIGGATAQDVQTLIEYIQRSVGEKTGYVLEREVYIF